MYSQVNCILLFTTPILTKTKIFKDHISVTILNNNITMFLVIRVRFGLTKITVVKILTFVNPKLVLHHVVFAGPNKESILRSYSKI